MLVSIEDRSKAKKVAQGTFSTMLLKGAQYFSEAMSTRVSAEFALFRYALVATELLGLEQVPDKEFETLCEMVRDRLKVFDPAVDLVDLVA